jgi:hypothetical protein
VLCLFDFKLSLPVPSASVASAYSSFRADFKLFLVNAHLMYLNSPELIMPTDQQS